MNIPALLDGSHSIRKQLPNLSRHHWKPTFVCRMGGGEDLAVQVMLANFHSAETRSDSRNRGLICNWIFLKKECDPFFYFMSKN